MDDECEAIGHLRHGDIRALEVLEYVSQPLVRVWVDKQSFLPLKTEVRDASGAVLERSEVTRVDYNVSMADSTFTYTPPAGMQVSTFNGGDGADVKRALNSAQEGKPLPAKP
jgi:negative regulator of sigma E activity